MRPSSPLLLLIGASLLGLPLAHAGPRGNSGGGGGGRGPLGQTSSGIGTATGSNNPNPPSGGGGSGTTPTGDPDENAVDRARRDCYDRHAHRIQCPRYYEPGAVVFLEPTTSVTESATPPSPYIGDRARFDFYAGAQKVADSDGSLSLEATIRDNHRFRLAGTLHHYFETQPDASRITMTMPTLTGGVRIDDLGSTSVYVDGGVVHASTKDPMGDSSITGPIVGMSVEHRVSPKLSLLGEARTMWFEDDVRANAGRIGVRYGHLQASFRVLDFNVGPPLYGPEVGVRF